MDKKVFSLQKSLIVQSLNKPISPSKTNSQISKKTTKHSLSLSPTKLSVQTEFLENSYLSEISKLNQQWDLVIENFLEKCKEEEKEVYQRTKNLIDLEEERMKMIDEHPEIESNVFNSPIDLPNKRSLSISEKSSQPINLELGNKAEILREKLREEMIMIKKYHDEGLLELNRQRAFQFNSINERYKKHIRLPLKNRES